MNKLIFLIAVTLITGCNSEQSNSSVKEVQRDPISVKTYIKKDTSAIISKVKEAELCSCDVEAYTPDKYLRLKVYSSPEDTVGSIIYNQGNFIMKIEAAKGNWFQLQRISDFDREFKKCKHRWVRMGDLEVKAVGDNNYTYKLYRYPADTAKVIGYTDNLWIISGCHGKWIFVKGLDTKKNNIYGWIPFAILCPNPYTNCYPELSIKKYIYSKNE